MFLYGGQKGTGNRNWHRGLNGKAVVSMTSPYYAITLSCPFVRHLDRSRVIFTFLHALETLVCLFIRFIFKLGTCYRDERSLNVIIIGATHILNLTCTN